MIEKISTSKRVCDSARSANISSEAVLSALLIERAQHKARLVKVAVAAEIIRTVILTKNEAAEEHKNALETLNVECDLLCDCLDAIDYLASKITSADLWSGLKDKADSAR